MPTTRQRHWQNAAETSNGLAAVLFTLLAQPSEAERGGHICMACDVHGFSRNGRRGLKCMICGDVKRWIDESS